MNEQEQQNKHELKHTHEYTHEQHIENMAQPVATIDIERNCAVLTFSPTHVFLLDYSAYNRYVTAGHKFSFQTPSDIYPCYVVNYKRHTLLDFVVQHGTKDMDYHYHNGNERDLRAHNLQIMHRFDSVVRDRYKDLDVEYIPGHVNVMGTGANMMKNPLWRIGQHQIVMYVEPNSLCLLCPESLEHIRVFERAHHAGKPLTFFCNSGGYVMCSVNLYMHQIIMDLHGNGRGTMTISVDHLDQNPLNNTLANLRIATREEQEQNSNGIKPDTKRQRMHYARALPAGIKQEDLRKNVVYYSEVYNKEKGLTREFFKVEGHPKLDKPWCSSKSGKVDAQAKLASANLVVDNLARGVFPEAPDNGLPNYVSLNINTAANKAHLIYERRVKPDVRQSLKMVIPAEHVLVEQLAKLNQKVVAKYGAEFNLIDF